MRKHKDKEVQAIRESTVQTQLARMSAPQALGIIGSPSVMDNVTYFYDALGHAISVTLQDVDKEVWTVKIGGHRRVWIGKIVQGCDV